jgi:hypothetical protein
MSHIWTIVSRGALAAAVAGLMLVPGTGAAEKRRGPALIKVKAPKKARGGAPLTLRATRHLRRVTVSVNGRRVRSNVGRDKRHVTRLALGATSRVRFGRNTIVVRAVDRRGHRQTLRRRVRVLRGTPLAGVRAPRRAVQGRPARLDARPSRAARGGRLRYRWRVVRRPARARATLRGARRARPSLRASHPGRYSLALTLVERGRKKARASATGCAVRAAAQPRRVAAVPKAGPAGPPASVPMHLLPAPGTLETIQPTARLQRPTAAPPRKAAPGCVTEVVHVDVQPNATGIGVAFDSRVQQDGQTGMRLGTTFYALKPGSTMALVLDAHTLETLSYSAVPPGIDPNLWADLQGPLYVLKGREPLFVLAGDNFTSVQEFGQSAATIAKNQGLQLADGDAAGRLSGYLQPSVPVDGATPTYQFVSPERVAFDTSVAGTPAGSNAMQIGGRRYEASLPAGESGFHVVVMDSAQRAQSSAYSMQQEQQLAQVLSRAAHTPGTTVFVQSIGRPRPASSAAPSVALALEQLGGTMWTYLGLDGSGSFALVGNPVPQGQINPLVAAAEASTQWQGSGHGTLQGVLRRRADQAFYAPLAAPTDDPNLGLAQVVYQAPTAWPETDTPGKVAATEWAAREMGLEPGPGSCYQPAEPDFRSSYCNTGIPEATFLEGLDGLEYPGPGHGFTADELTAVVTQLKKEVGYVGTVRALIDNLEGPFEGQNPAVDSSAIAGEIIQAIPPAEESAVSGDLELASAVLYLAADTPVPGADKVLGPVASALDLASILTEDGGEPSPDWDIQSSAGLMGKTVRDRLSTTVGNLARYEDILLSDWGKLEAAGSASESVWGVTPEGITDRKSIIELGIEQWLWTAILPSAFDLVDVPGVPAGQPGQVWCVYNRAPVDWRPWSKADPRSTFFPLDGWGASGPTPSRLMAMLSGRFSNNHSKPVSPKLAGQMFASPDNGGAGLVQPWLYERAKWDFQTPRMAQPSTGLVPGVCGIGSD